LDIIHCKAEFLLLAYTYYRQKSIKFRQIHTYFSMYIHIHVLFFPPYYNDPTPDKRKTGNMRIFCISFSKIYIMYSCTSTRNLFEEKKRKIYNIHTINSPKLIALHLYILANNSPFIINTLRQSSC
jgi:hypothetical protein